MHFALFEFSLKLIIKSSYNIEFHFRQRFMSNYSLKKKKVFCVLHYNKKFLAGHSDKKKDLVKNMPT